ncbi:MAG: glycoside hydrolase family 13 protein [Bacteroidales bacterium]|nr:glycoside hydrolase family 13 protein [Bacteroidales bacterium]
MKMCRMLKPFIALVFMIGALSLTAQEVDVQRVEPPFWWSGMNNPELQVLVYGTDIANSRVNIEKEGLTLNQVIKVSNPNYLFLEMIITPDAEAGTYPIEFTSPQGAVYEYQYELKKRKPGSAERKGFSPADAIYLLMPDRFANGNPGNDNIKGMKQQADRSDPDGRHGGDIQGIIDHLDYIRNLGATAMWINPLLENDNPEYSYHGYAITDFYEVDPRFGDNAMYKKLVQKSHQKGMKVIMDMIFNHSSLYHWFIQDLPMPNWIHQQDTFYRSNFRGSVHMDPHVSDYDYHKFITGWFDNHMPDLNQKNDLLSDYLIQNTIWWIEYSGIDGIRVDTQPYSYKNFIAEWGERIFNEYPDFNIVGESWLQKESITAYFQGGSKLAGGYDSNLPSVTDFPLHFAMNDAFKESEGWTTGLARLYYVLAQDFLYGDPYQNLIFLDNHDLTRYYSSVGKDMNKFKMGIAFLLTTRGIPMIYYGTEILKHGKEHEGHGGIRTDFPGGWPDDDRNAFLPSGRTEKENEAFSYISNLLNWRRETPVIHHGKLVHYIPENGIYVYFRHHENEAVMVVLNNKDKEQTIKTTRYKKDLEDFNSAYEVTTDKMVENLSTLKVPGKSAMVIELIK